MSTSSIQIQHLLKLNDKFHLTGKPTAYSNTTLVKVKFLYIYTVYRIIMHSNTTLVKVK